MLNKNIDKGLKELRLPTIREIYAPLAQKAQSDTVAYEEYLFWLIEQEQESRRVSRIERRLEESKIPLSKDLSAFQMKRHSVKFGIQVKSLCKGDFIRQKENLLIFGNPGSGKTHLLCAIGQELIRSQDMRVLFTTNSRLMQELLLAKKNLQLTKVLKKLTFYQGIILDDIGYVEQSKEEVEVLFTFISECYEKTSLLISSNLPFSKWDLIFKDQMMATAAVDRLIHHSVILEMNVTSYRMESSKEKQKKENASMDEKKVN
ncbi:MAG: IS21-like element helper ATPase IstB [Chlamydiota bacterium]